MTLSKEIMSHKRPCVLILLDGWGIDKNRNGNAVALAKTPRIDRLIRDYPHTSLLCSGEAAGLPRGTMGNSEVGHLNIGAGRVVLQDLLRINRAIENGSFFENKAICDVMEKVKKNGSTLHLMGLLSDGGVHSHTDHLSALVDMAEKKKIERVHIHPVLDGRDTPPKSGLGYIKKLKERVCSKKSFHIATVCGRFYAMDRDKRWNRIEKAFRLYALAEGNWEDDPESAVKNAYKRNETDEFIQPTAIKDKHGNLSGMRDGDAVIFFNFRADRAREITRVFTDHDFDIFPTDSSPRLCDYVCMTPYDEKFLLPTAFPQVHMKDIIGEVVSKNGLSQLRIAETEKYAHVTYFFNGGKEEVFPLESRCLVPSPRDVRTYDLKPEMSAFEVTEKVVSKIDSQLFDMIVLNFANMDMVGHTGILSAAVRACEAVDVCVGKVVDRILEKGGVALVTSDHGNAERIVDENGEPHTAHTLNPVPFIMADDSRKDARLRPGALADIAPTILDIMGIEKPRLMTGESLIET